MEHVTLKHVAKVSGFSVTTVSRVLGGTDYPISAEARDAITKAAKDLGYIPNMLARGLKTCVSKEVAVIMPSITNPFYTSMTMGIEGELSAKGYNMLVYLTSGSDAKDCEMIGSLRGKMIAGVIVAADCITEALVDTLRMLKKSNIPFVVTDYDPNLAEPTVGVFFDYRRGGQMAARYLLQQGHCYIAFATRTLDKLSRRSRKDGFCETMAAAGASFTEEDVFVSSVKDEFKAGVELAQQVLHTGKMYTAISANNDAVALGILSELAKCGLKVPEDISVIGFDDCVFSRMSIPLLTTVQVPAEEMGKMAAQFMLNELEIKKTQYSIYLEPKIVERQSVRKIETRGETVV